MSKHLEQTTCLGSVTDIKTVKDMIHSLEHGCDWMEALIKAISLWTKPKETYRGRTYNYFIAGEAFDWLLLAERLCKTAGKLVPKSEFESLLFHGMLPLTFDKSKFRTSLGVDKYRGYLNFFYGVTVEEALLLATELEVQKQYDSNGVGYKSDYTDTAYIKIYGQSQDELLRNFHQKSNLKPKYVMKLNEHKEFTYWMFKYRLETSDKAKIASDTKKGLGQLQRMRNTLPTSAHSSLLGHGIEVEKSPGKRSKKCRMNQPKVPIWK